MLLLLKLKCKPLVMVGLLSSNMQLILSKFNLFLSFAGRLRRTGHFARTYTGGWVVHKKAK
jgi:hypothetical protein